MRTIAAALEDLSIPALVLSLVHITGDPSWIRGDIRPQGLFLNEVQGFMSEEDEAEVRRRALGAIRDWRDGGCKPPPPPSPELVHEMMSWLVCTDVPPEYVPMLLEGGYRSMVPRRDVHDAYDERLQEALGGLVWTHPSVRHSWYENAQGRIHGLSPWRLVDYWDWTRAPDPGDFELA